MLMGMLYYLYAVIGILSFRENDPIHFHSLHMTTVTLFRCGTDEDWTDVM